MAEDADYQNDPTIKQWKVWDEPQWTALKNRWIAPLFMTKLSHRKLSHLTEIAHAGLMGEMVVDVVSRRRCTQGRRGQGRGQGPQLLGS